MMCNLMPVYRLLGTVLFNYSNLLRSFLVPAMVLVSVSLLPFRVIAGPLHVAVKKGEYQEARQLLNAGANPNIPNLCGQSTLQLAVSNNDNTMIDVLLSNGADPSLTDTQRTSTALHLAAYLGDVETIAQLLQAGANIDQQDNHGHTPLIRAVYSQKQAAVATLLKHGANVHTKDFFRQNNALEIADRIGAEGIAKMISDYHSNAS